MTQETSVYSSMVHMEVSYNGGYSKMDGLQLKIHEHPSKMHDVLGYPYSRKPLYVGFLSHRGTPKHHPNFNGIVHHKPSILGVATIYGNLHIFIPPVIEQFAIARITIFHMAKSTDSMGHFQ